MVNDPGQRLPELPAGLPQDSQHETANLVHSAAVRLLRRALRTPTSTWTVPEPRCFRCWSSPARSP